MGFFGTAAKWRELVEGLTKRACKSTQQIQQERMRAMNAAKAAGAPKGRRSTMDGPVARLPASERVVALRYRAGGWPVIERWHELREWCPVTLRYVKAGWYSTWEMR